MCRVVTLTGNHAVRCKTLIALLPLFCGCATQGGVTIDPPLGGSKYDAMLTLTMTDPDQFEYRLEAPRTIDGMDYSLSVLVYANQTVIDGNERTGPLIDMKESEDSIVGDFVIPEENRQPQVWAVIYYGNLGSDESWLRAYALVIDYPED